MTPFDTRLSDLATELTVPSSRLQEISKQFSNALNNGLAKSSSSSIKLPMLPAFVTTRINGQEEGSFLALDLGGTNLRICKVDLLGNGQLKISQNSIKITNEIKTMQGGPFFATLADFVLKFLEQQGLSSADQFRMGFTFSFPLKQTRIDNGLLLVWNKGFSIPEVVGKDVAELLQNEFKSRKMNIRVSAVVNDTVGALLAGAYKDPCVNIGVIFGTGTNAAYYERAERIEGISNMNTAKEMVINTEWGSFSEKAILPMTRFDEKVDQMSENPCRQIFEKMIGGMYVGEIARLIVLELAEGKLLFGGKTSEALHGKYGFDTKYVSECIMDSSNELASVKKVIADVLGIADASIKDCMAVKQICELVAVRAARLSSAALSAILLQRPELFEDGKSIGVGADGSVFEFLPGFEKELRKGMNDIIGEREKQVKLLLAKDGSGIGAALMALAAN